MCNRATFGKLLQKHREAIDSGSDKDSEKILIQIYEYLNNFHFNTETKNSIFQHISNNSYNQHEIENHYSIHRVNISNLIPCNCVLVKILKILPHFLHL